MEVSFGLSRGCRLCRAILLRGHGEGNAALGFMRVDGHRMPADLVDAWFKRLRDRGDEGAIVGGIDARFSERLRRAGFRHQGDSKSIGRFSS
jgi:hypothetical protein